MRLLLALFLLTAMMQQPTHATERARLGFGMLVTNDLIGDGRDRWRTGSVATSRVWGPGWDGALPEGFGEIIELRFNGEVISPGNISQNAPGDRPYVGALSLGIHTHFQRGGFEFSTGGDIVATGPATKLDELQSEIHDLINIRQPSAAVKDAQIQNGIYPTAVVEVGRTLRFSDNAKLRPFVEGRAGIETLVRGGVDLTIGRLGDGEMMVRDPVTGHRYRTIQENWDGLSFVVGADVAHVIDSEYFPENRGIDFTDSRERVRAGVHWQNGDGAAAFYGLTWLGKEFENQSDSQIVGSIRFRVNF